jgi:hypothetical protein
MLQGGVSTWTAEGVRQGEPPNQLMRQGLRYTLQGDRLDSPRYCVQFATLSAGLGERCRKNQGPTWLPMPRL